MIHTLTTVYIFGLYISIRK